MDKLFLTNSERGEEYNASVVKAKEEQRRKQLTVIYLDTLFFLNFGLDSLLLAASRRLSGSGARGSRVLLAALAGACYASAVFCTGWEVLSHPAVRCMAAAGMVWLAAEGRREWLRMLLLFVLLSCALAGGILLMQVTGIGSLSGGKGFPTTGQDGRLLLLCGAGEYALVGLAAGKGTKGETTAVLLCCEGRRVMLRALKDTGNLLRDPVSGQRVLVAEYQRVRPLFPEKCRPKGEMLLQPEVHLAQLMENWEPSRLRLLPFRAVGTKQGMLLAVRVDVMEVEGERRENQLVAVVDQRLSGDGSYQGVLGY